MRTKAFILICSIVLSSSAALAWKTGIGIIDNNVPKAIQNPEMIIKDPVGAAADALAKSGCYNCDKIVEKALPEEKKAIANAILTTGFVTSPLGPVGGILTLAVIVQAAKDKPVVSKDIPVNIPPSDLTGTTIEGTFDCIVQLSNKRINAFAIQKPAMFDQMTRGDKVNLHAPKVCPEYNSASGETSSVTSATIKLEGAASDPLAVEGKEFKYMISGSLI